MMLKQNSRWRKILLLLVLLFHVIVAKISSHRQLQEDEEQHQHKEESKRLPPTSYISENMPLLQLYIGNPAQQRTLAVSTSGDYTALPCQDCTSCDKSRNPTLEFYQFSQSTSFQRFVGCEDCSIGTSCFKDNPEFLCMVGKSRYDKSSWSGYEVKDYALAIINGGGERQEREEKEEESMSSIVGTDAAVQYGFELNFVCQTTTRGYYNHVMDGLLGLSYAPTSFLRQIYAAGRLDRPIFSICFLPQQEQQNRNNNNNEEEDDVATAGVVKLGGYEQSYLERGTDMLYVQNTITDNDASYKVEIVRFYLHKGGDYSENTALQLLSSQEDHNDAMIVVDYTSNTTISSTPSLFIDTSTTFLNFDQRLEQSFKDAWKKITKKAFSKARHTLTTKELQQMPTLILELKGADNAFHELDPKSVPALTDEYNVYITIPAIHYMNDANTVQSPKHRYRAEINFDSPKGSIFGLNSMKGYTISFEPDKSRIGFAKSRSCPKLPVFSNQGNNDSTTTELGKGRSFNDNPDDDIAITTSSARDGQSRKKNGRIFSFINDDDLYTIATAEGKDTIYSTDLVGGLNCNTATCRCLMSIGYVLVGTVLAVVYRLSRPKEAQLYGIRDIRDIFQFRKGAKSKQDKAAEETYAAAVAYSNNNAYRRKTFDDGGGAVMA